MTVGEEEAPQRGLQHSVEPLVKRPGGEVAAPVVVVAVGVREEVAAKRRQRRPRCREGAVEGAEVVGEGSKLSLGEEEKGCLNLTVSTVSFTVTSQLLCRLSDVSTFHFLTPERLSKLPMCPNKRQK